MKSLKVIDVIFRKQPNKIIIYLGDKLLFNNYTYFLNLIMIYGI